MAQWAAMEVKIKRKAFSLSVNWCLYLSFVSVLTIPLSAAHWWALCVPFAVIVLGHKRLKQIRKQPNYGRKFGTYTGLAIGYFIVFVSFLHLFGIVTAAKQG